ncbi:exported protein of unknown function [Candidatus Hydrogenisulfobacillus filiaventi]|uniref:3D domain-containing protein n=1 Tax=Candidatus Hydrogenisulfobacillus filiaventi TaxID=2707344 RepID=A0A6F8ZFH1_9FIRM|nr:3D domain-containing protein [Bacillota bacterium]CAB1128527.1 exported protein of unknown function [Candidatus Hydrogenisulfobacillus filiaventi]
MSNRYLAALLLAGAAGPMAVVHPAHAAAPPAHTLVMTATAYGPSRRDNFPFGPVTFYGQPLVAGDVAVDPRVIPLGSRLYITGYRSPDLPQPGFYAVACDTGDAIQGDRIDIFLNGGPAQVAAFGIQAVRVTILPAPRPPAPPTGRRPRAGALKPDLLPVPGSSLIAEPPWRQPPPRPAAS